MGMKLGKGVVRLVLHLDHLVWTQTGGKGQGNSAGEQCWGMGPRTELGRGEHAPWVVVSSVQEAELEPAGRVKGPLWAGRRGQR